MVNKIVLHPVQKRVFRATGRNSNRPDGRTQGQVILILSSSSKAFHANSDNNLRRDTGEFTHRLGYHKEKGDIFGRFLSTGVVIQKMECRLPVVTRNNTRLCRGNC